MSHVRPMVPTHPSIRHAVPLALLLGLLAASVTRASSSPPVVSVGLLLYQRQVTLSSTTGMKVVDSVTGGKIDSRFGGSSVSLSSRLAGIRYGGSGRAYKRITALPLAGGFLKVNGHGYRGHIHLRLEPGGTMCVINELDVETYLRGVVQSEMLASSPPEALKVQAMIARTFVLRNRGGFKDRGFDVKATTQSQVYKGVEWEDPRTDRAVQATRGLVIQSGGQLVETLYHASCGGATENNEDVWKPSTPVPELRARVCVPCRKVPPPIWSANISYDVLRRALQRTGHRTGSIQGVELSRTRTGRASTVTVRTSSGPVTVTGNELRMMLDPTRVKSLAMVIRNQAPASKEQPYNVGDRLVRTIIAGYLATEGMNRGRNLALVGRGNGHGVGLCQHGAAVLAGWGKGAREIIDAYYKKVSISRLY